MYAIRITALIGAFIFLLGSTGFATLSADNSQDGFVKYISQYHLPEFVQDNPRALEARVKLLDHAPNGATVKILTFVWENGKATNRLAAHMCAAAKRGVNVSFLVDSKYGSLPQNDLHFFDHPINEELYQWMVNCGVSVRIYNHIDPSWTERVYKDRFLLGSSKSLKGLKKVVEEMIDLYGKKEAIPLNRLNHRKLFFVQMPIKGKPQGCMILGGRNLGDHYLDWEDDGDNFLDEDLVLCRGSIGHVVEMKNGQTSIRQDKINENRVFQEAENSFDELWNGGTETIDGKSFTIQNSIDKNSQFRYKEIYFEDPAQNELLDSKENIFVEKFGEEFSIDEETNREKRKEYFERWVPEAKDFDRPGTKAGGWPLANAYDWTVLRSHWYDKNKPIYSDDAVRNELLQSIRREQSHFSIESAYLTLDQELQNGIEEALERGVHVTLVTNSAFTMDGIGAKGITLRNSPFLERIHAKFNNADGSPKLAGKGKLRVMFLSPVAGHMLHFKGAGFTCQMLYEGGKPHYFKRFIAGSHNFHPRSGLSDKEHALVWKEKVGDLCIKKVDSAKGSLPPINHHDISYDPGLADRQDAIGKRIRWYKLKIKDFEDNEVELVVDYPDFYREWAKYNPEDKESPFYERFLNRLAVRFFRDKETGALTKRGTLILNMLGPEFEGFL